MLCPRRDEVARSPIFKMPIEDVYLPDRHTCSYCGSVDPAVFMRRLEAGDIELGATDKNYKVYVNNLGGDSIGIKFYFQHLSEEQMKRFVELFNEKRLKFQGGIGFYNYPFFMAPAT